MPTNEYDPRHPHERREPPVRPVFDSEGRCLVCGREILEERVEKLVAVLAEVQGIVNTVLADRIP